MKEGWTYKKFKEVCTSITDGDWIEKKDQSQSGIRLVQTGNIGIGEFIPKDDSHKYISEETFNRLRCTEIFEGDILISRLPNPLGRSCILPKLDTRCITAVDCSILRIKKDAVLPKFFVYYTQSQGYFSKIDSESSGTTRARITRKKLEETTIPIPPVSKQILIVERLDAAFAHIDELKANAEKQLTEARALFHNCLTKAMEPKEGWEEKTIGELTDSCLGKMLDKQKNKGEYQPYLRNINVRWGGFDLSDILEMKFEDDEDERYGIKTGDLIICEGGEPGRCAIWEGQIENMKIQKALHRVRCRKDLLNSYLYYSIMFYAQNGVLEKYESGATIKHLTGEALRKIPLSYPSLSEQQRIVARLDSLSENVRKYEEIQRKVISECDALKQALLRKVFE